MDENMENQTKNPDLPISGDSRESLRIQRTEYVRRQLSRRKEREDRLMAQLIKEQSIIDGLQERIDEDLEQTEETVRFNRELKERMSDQIYNMHGVSKDKLEGIEQYRDAWRRGSVFSMFILSLALVVLCGVLHGFDSQVCLFMLAFTGVEGALIAQDRNGYKVLNWICRFLSFLMFPAMLVMFTCYELGYKEYELFLPYAAMGGAGIVVIAVLTYFIYDPYSKAKRDARAAKSHLSSIERAARKEIVKNRKKQAADEKKAQKRTEKDAKPQPEKESTLPLHIPALKKAPETEAEADEDEGPDIDELPEDFSLDEPERKKESFLSRFRRKDKNSEGQSEADETPAPAAEIVQVPAAPPVTDPAPVPAPELPESAEAPENSEGESTPEVVSMSVSSGDDTEQSGEIA